MSRMPAIGGERRWLRIAALVALGLGQASAAGVAAFATRMAFGALHQGGIDLPLWTLAAIAAAGVAIAGFRWSERVVAERLGQDYVAALRLRLFDHVAHSPAGDVARQRIGAMSLRFVGDLTAVRVWVSLGIGRLLSVAIVLPVLLAVLFALDQGFGLAAAATFSCAIIAILVLGPNLGPIHRRLRAQRARLASDVAERLPQAPELRLMGRLQLERQHLTEHAGRLIGAFMERQRRAALLRVIPDVAHGATAALLLWMALMAGVEPADAAGALAALALMVHPLRDLASVWDKYGAWQNARSRCEALLARRTLPAVQVSAATDCPSGRSKAPPRIELVGVSHGALKDLSLVVAAGEKIGIGGYNGAGKSTLLVLCAGLEAPEQGEVRVDGRPLTGMSDTERQCVMAYAGPRSPVLAGSLRRALTLGLRKRPANRIIKTAARRFGLGPLLDRPGGLDSRVAEGGRNLSAGEYRRLLLTRVALTDAPMLLLDEPGESLDPPGLEQLQRFLREREATIIVVSHDLSRLRGLDRIYLLQDGRLAETGSTETQYLADPQVGNGRAGAPFELDRAS